MSARSKLLIAIGVVTVLTVAGSIVVYSAIGGMGTLIVDVHVRIRAATWFTSRCRVRSCP